MKYHQKTIEKPEQTNFKMKTANILMIKTKFKTGTYSLLSTFRKIDHIKS